MVRLSFFNNLFKKKKEKRDLIPDELGKLLEEKVENQKDTILKQSKSIVKEVLSSAAQIHAEIEKIKTSKIPDNIPIKLKRIVKTSQPSFVASANESINPFLGKKESDFSDIEKLHKDLKKCLDSLAKAHVNQGRYLPIPFEHEFASIKKESKNLLEQSDKLGEIVKKSNKENKLLNKTLEQYNELIENQEKIQSINDSIKDYNRKMISLVDMRDKIIGKKDKLKKSTGYKDLSRQKDEIKDLEDKISELESKIFHLLTPLKRPLKKYRKQAFESDKGVEKRIDAYIDNPLKQFLSDDVKDLNSLLNKLDRYIEEGRVTLKDKEKKKTRDKIKKMLDSNLDSIRKEHDELNKKLIKLSDSINSSDVNDKKDNIQNELKSLENEINILEEEIDNLEKKVNNLSGSISKLRVKVESGLSDIEGRNIEIKWS